MTVIYYYCSFKHWLNTDTSLHGQFYLSLGKALTFSFKSNRLMWTPINMDIRHLFPAKSTDSHRKQTSLMRTIHHQLCAVKNLSFLKVKKPSVDSKSMFPKLCSTLERKNYRSQFQTFLASQHSENDFD